VILTLTESIEFEVDSKSNALGSSILSLLLDSLNDNSKSCEALSSELTLSCESLCSVSVQLDSQFGYIKSRACCFVSRQSITIPNTVEDICQRRLSQSISLSRIGFAPDLQPKPIGTSALLELRIVCMIRPSGAKVEFCLNSRELCIWLWR